jgi:hypothetical protein
MTSLIFSAQVVSQNIHRLVLQGSRLGKWEVCRLLIRLGDRNTRHPLVLLCRQQAPTVQILQKGRLKVFNLVQTRLMVQAGCRPLGGCEVQEAIIRGLGWIMHNHLLQ